MLASWQAMHMVKHSEGRDIRPVANVCQYFKAMYAQWSWVLLNRYKVYKILSMFQSHDFP